LRKKSRRALTRRRSRESLSQKSLAIHQRTRAPKVPPRLSHSMGRRWRDFAKFRFAVAAPRFGLGGFGPECQHSPPGLCERPPCIRHVNDHCALLRRRRCAREVVALFGVAKIFFNWFHRQRHVLVGAHPRRNARRRNSFRRGPPTACRITARATGRESCICAEA
jgi:hypothetical protein